MVCYAMVTQYIVFLVWSCKLNSTELNRMTLLAMDGESLVGASKMAVVNKIKSSGSTVTVPAIIFITQRYPNLVEKATFSPKVFGTQLFLFLFDFFEEIGYQKTQSEKIAFST